MQHNHLDSVEKFQSILAALLYDHIERLTDLKSNDIDINNKLDALDQYKQQLESANTLLDLIILVNEMLVDSRIIKIRNSGKSTLEIHLVNFAKLISDKLSLPASLNTKMVNIISFTDQLQLLKVLDSYLQVYGEKNPALLAPKFNAMQMVKSQDGALVFFDLYAFINEKTISGRKNNGAIGRKLVNGIKEASAYMLAQEIDPSFVTDKLRLCFAVNHQQAHWTSLIIDVNGFSDLYKKFFEVKRQVIDFNQYRSDADLHAAQYKYIYQALNILNKDYSSYDLAKAFAQNNISLTLTSYDSLNCNAYYSQIVDCVIELSNYLDLWITQRACSQQKGNTCGDHTVLNLIGVSLYSTLPSINELASKITSSTLRIFTNEEDLDNKMAYAGFITEEAVLNQMLNKKLDFLVQELPDNPLANCLMKIITLYSERIYLLSPANAANILDLVLTTEAVNTSKIEAILKNRLAKFSPGFFSSQPIELEERVFTLAGIIHNNNNKMKQLIFDEIGIANEDSAPYCVVSRLALQARQVEMERRKLSSEYPLEYQQSTFNSYNKK